MRIYYTTSDGIENIKEFNVNPVTIGSSENNILCIKNAAIAEKHAEISFKNDQYYIKDNDSFAGVFVNGELIDISKINIGDEILIGDIVIKILPEKNKNIENKKISEKESNINDTILGNIFEEKQFFNENSILSEDVDSTFLKRLLDIINNGAKNKNKLLLDCVKAYNSLVELIKKISNDLNISQILDNIAELLKNKFCAEQGFIILKNSKTGEFSVESSLNSNNSKLKVSSSIIKKVINSSKIYYSADASSEIDSSKSISELKITSILCIPLKIKNKIIGCIYLSNTQKNAVFSEIDILIIEQLASLISITIENARLHKIISKQERIRGNLQKFLSPDIIGNILNGKKELSLGGERKVVTILFSDIRGFTSLAEKMDAVELVTALNEYYPLMIDAVFKNNGTLDKLIGDSVMAVFGAPFSYADDTLRACRTALKMHELCNELNKIRISKNKVPIKMGIGINTGEVVAGNIGSLQKMEFTVIGDNVNIAARIQGSAKSGEIILSGSTYDIIKDKVIVKELKSKTFKGKSEPVRIYKLIDIIE